MSEPLIAVRIRDRAAEAPWGSGLTSPVVRTVEISANCPQCGGPRGERRSLRQHDDGATYYVDVWDNACGHVDLFGPVAREAAAIREQRALSYPEPGSYIPDQPGFVVAECGHRVANQEWRVGFRTCERCAGQRPGGGAS